MLSITYWFFFRNASTTTYLTTEGGSVKRIFTAMPSVPSSTAAASLSQPHVSLSGSITLPNSAVTVTPTNAAPQQPPQLQLPMSVAANLNVVKQPMFSEAAANMSSSSVTVSLTPAIPEVDREEVISSSHPPSVIVTPAPAIINNGTALLKSEHHAPVSTKVEVTPIIEDKEAKRPKLE